MNSTCTALAPDTDRARTADKPARAIETLPYPSASLLSFVKRQVAQTEAFEGLERRSALRHMLVMPVTVYPVDENIHPSAPPAAMVIRNISETGLGLVAEHPFSFPRIVVRLSFPQEGQVLAAEVRWTRPTGPFYLVGCEVIGKLESFAYPS